MSVPAFAHSDDSFKLNTLDRAGLRLVSRRRVDNGSTADAGRGFVYGLSLGIAAWLWIIVGAVALFT